jgi:hypothetical protein
MLWVSAAVFPTLKQNLTQILCFFADSILKTKWNAQYSCITNGQISLMHFCSAFSFQKLCILFAKKNKRNNNMKWQLQMKSQQIMEIKLRILWKK